MMMYLSLIVMIIYYLIFIFYCKKLNSVKESKIWLTILSLVVLFLIYWWVGEYLFYAAFPLATIVMFLALKVVTNMNFLQSFFCASLCVLNAYCIRGIFTSISSLTLAGTHIDFLTDKNIYYVMTLLTLPVSLFVLLLLRKYLFSDQKIRNFLNTGTSLKLVVAYQIIASINLGFINLAFINFGRTVVPITLYYMVTALIACLLTVCMMYIVVYYSIKNYEKERIEASNFLLSNQYQQQLAHYNELKKHSEAFKKFRHDHHATLATLKILIEKNHQTEAEQVIKNMEILVSNLDSFPKKFSNSVVLDCMMQELSRQCNEHSILLSFKGGAPKNTELSLMDGIHVFYNLTSNAVEACLKVPKNKRFISIKSFSSLHWATLHIENSFNNEVSIVNDKFVSTKAQKEKHGFGLENVNEICGRLGGIMSIDIDTDNSIFSVRVHMPRNKDKQKN